MPLPNLVAEHHRGTPIKGGQDETQITEFLLHLAFCRDRFCVNHFAVNGADRIANRYEQADVSGAQLVINGSGFGSQRPAVSLANTQLTVSSFTDKQIIAALPDGLNYLLTVTNSSSYFHRQRHSFHTPRVTSIEGFNLPVVLAFDGENIWVTAATC